MGCWSFRARVDSQLTIGTLPSYNLGQKVLRILHFLTHRTPILRIWYHYDPCLYFILVNLVQSGAKMIQADFNLGEGARGRGGEGGGVFVIAGALKSFILKLPIVASIFLNILWWGQSTPQMLHEC